jgi:DNA repair protein RadB
MISTGNLALDEKLKMPLNEVVMVYGDPASGKTTLAFQVSLETARKGGRVIFVDVENTFSLDRLKQMDPFCEKYMDKIIVFSPRSFEEQERVILNLPFNVDLVVVDSMSKYYRDEKKNDPSGVNVRLITLLRKLHKFVDREIPVLVTNQVYAGEAGVQPVGGNMIKRWSQYLIRLQKIPRKLFVEKPLFNEFDVGIDDKGLLI